MSALSKWHSDMPTPRDPKPADVSERRLPSSVVSCLERFAASHWQWRVDACTAVERVLAADAHLPWKSTTALSTSHPCVSAPPTLPALSAGSRIPVTLVVGPFGAGKTRLATALSKFTASEYSWHVITFPLTEATEDLAEGEVQVRARVLIERRDTEF